MHVYTTPGWMTFKVSIGRPANLGHIQRHAVTPLEVEEAAGRPHVTILATIIRGEKRWKLSGKTAFNHLVVVFTFGGNGFAR